MKNHKSRKKNPKAEAAKLDVSDIVPSAKKISAVMTLISQGRCAEAIEFAQALTIRFPLHVFGWKVLSAMLHSTGKSSEALLPMMMAVILAPDDAEAHNNLGEYFKDVGRFEEAEAICRRAIQIDPEFAEGHNNLANILIKLKRLDEAVVISQRALELKPHNANMHSTLGLILMNMERLGEAETSFVKALKYDPNHYMALNNVGMVSANLGRPNEDCFKKALAISPDKAAAHTNWLFYLSLSSTVTASALFTEHLRFAQQFETPLMAYWQVHGNDRDPNRCLQVGFVSGDFYDHAVATFIEPLLMFLSKVSSLTLHAYANHPIDDEVSKRLKGYFSHWTPVIGLNDDELAAKIRADSIDILLDLSGHTAYNRLLTFARKPAPIQASWMGYPGTTGLQAMDYYLADQFFLPQEPFKDQFTEKLVYLPASAPFMPYEAAPDVNELPALTKGYITFGSFNRLNKLSPAVIAVWAKLMLALPTSRLILAALPESGYDTVIAWFAEQGIDQERLSFYPRRNMAIYMTLHHQVDICLDTFPYNGGTTTCHALWMGVPTLTLAGQTPAGRSGATLLSHVGLESLIAENTDDFVNKGLSLANDLEQLDQIRMGLRTRYRLSVTQQPELIAKGLEHSFRLMWKRWCEDLSPMMLDVTDTQISTESSAPQS
jgi:protein O-GlcNAc transferase